MRVLRELAIAARLFLLIAVAGPGMPVRSQIPGTDAVATASPPIPARPHRLELTGEFRSRLEGVSGAGFRPNATDLYLLSRIRLAIQLAPLPWLKVKAQAQDSHVFWKNQHPAAPPFQDTFDLRQGYVEIGDLKSGIVDFRAGRQELSYGDERLIGNSNFTNTARSFDAIRGTFQHQGARLEAFAASVVKIRDLHFNKSVPGADIYGLYGGFEKLVPRAIVEPYFFWRRSSGVTPETGTPGVLHFGTLGFRWVGKLPHALDYGVEMAGQSGSAGTDTVRAWAGHWLLGHSFPGIKFAPRVFAEFNYASGDHNPRDGRRGTFDQLYPGGHDKFGLADQVGWKNIQHLRGAVELKLTAKWRMDLKHNWWWLADPHDGLYNSSGNVVARVLSGTAGRYVGQETDIQASVNFARRFQAVAGFGHIFPGTFLRNSTAGTPYNFPYTSLTYTF